MKPQSGAAQTRRIRRTEVEWFCAGAFDNPVLGISAFSFQGCSRRLDVIFRPHPTSRISLGIKKNRWRCDLPFAHHSAKDGYLYTENVCYLLRGYFGLSHFFHRKPSKSNLRRASCVGALFRSDLDSTDGRCLTKRA
jgi:hypothetical protein